MHVSEGHESRQSKVHKRMHRLKLTADYFFFANQGRRFLLVLKMWFFLQLSAAIINFQRAISLGRTKFTVLLFIIMFIWLLSWVGGGKEARFLSICRQINADVI